MLTKQGKILLARQFVEMTRMKVENHLATFPKLVGTERQHNTVETAEVRYVYQPIESLILVLVTTKHSNIVEDLETLRLFAKIVPEYCPGDVDEASVCKNAFELLFAFDEIIACGCGQRENVTLRDVQVALEMESHEEKLANMIRQSKEREAQQEMVRKAKQISRENRSKGIGSGGLGSMRDFADDLRTGAAQASAALEQSATLPGMGAASTLPFPGGGGGGCGGYAPPPKKGSGMQLGASKKGATRLVPRARRHAPRHLHPSLALPSCVCVRALATRSADDRVPCIRAPQARWGGVRCCRQWPRRATWWTNRRQPSWSAAAWRRQARARAQGLEWCRRSRWRRRRSWC